MGRVGDLEEDLQEAKGRVVELEGRLRIMEETWHQYR